MLRKPFIGKNKDGERQVGLVPKDGIDFSGVDPGPEVGKPKIQKIELLRDGIKLLGHEAIRDIPPPKSRRTEITFDD